jgi:hypothetical protein
VIRRGGRGEKGNSRSLTFVRDDKLNDRDKNPGTMTVGSAAGLQRNAPRRQRRIRSGYSSPTRRLGMTAKDGKAGPTRSFGMTAGSRGGQPRRSRGRYRWEPGLCRSRLKTGFIRLPEILMGTEEPPPAFLKNESANIRRTDFVPVVACESLTSRIRCP